MNTAFQNGARAKVLRPEDLPPFKSDFSAEADVQIAAYFQHLADQSELSEAGHKHCLLLPSLDSMMQFLNVKQRDVLNALRQIRNYGYDTFTPGMYGHITLWTKTA